MNADQLVTFIKSHLSGAEGWTHPFHPLQAPLTSTAWDGDSFSTEAATLLDLSAVFGVPAGVKAVLVRLQTRDSAAWGTADLYTSVGPSATVFYEVTCRCFGGDVWNNALGICACDANGDIYYRILASGAGTMDVYIQILGYWL